VKIAIFIDSLAIGGAQKHVSQLACELADGGQKVTVFVLNEILEPLYTAPLTTAGVEVVVVGKCSVLMGSGILRVAWRLWAEDFDGVITVLFVSTIFGRLAAQVAGGIPVLTSLQARNINYALWQKYLVCATSGLAAFTVSNSRTALIWAAKQEGVNLRASAYIPNAIVPALADDPAPTWAQIGLSQLENKRVIGSFGRLHHQKGYDLLLDAIASIPPAILNSLAVVIFGEGPERMGLLQRVKQLNLQELVFFPGQRDDAVRLLPRLELYVQPSRFEGTPNALGEAMAARLPVIATAVDGNAELVADGVTGLLALPESPSSLRFSIVRLLEDRELSVAMASRAQSFILENYSTSRDVRRFAELIRQLNRLRS